MIEQIREISQLLGVEPFWIWLDSGLLVLLGIVKCMYPWKPVWKSKQTKDKNGNKITVYYRLNK